MLNEILKTFEKSFSYFITGVKQSIFIVLSKHSFDSVALAVFLYINGNQSFSDP